MIARFGFLGLQGMYHAKARDQWQLHGNWRIRYLVTCLWGLRLHLDNGAAPIDQLLILRIQETATTAEDLTSKVAAKDTVSESDEVTLKVLDRILFRDMYSME